MRELFLLDAIEVQTEAIVKYLLSLLFYVLNLFIILYFMYQASTTEPGILPKLIGSSWDSKDLLMVRYKKVEK